MFHRLRTLGVFSLLLLASTWACADAQRFDLIGPKVDVHVTRAGRTLPIAQVPNLLPGDKLWLHADMPATQSVNYLLVAVFLRGTTNPPPDKWFYKIETWDKKVSEEGVTITVPNEAQQAILFLAPETGGDFSTLRSAVRGRPGVFVRASQDLIEAGFEQARIEKYLASMRFVPPGDPKALLAHSNFLASTLNLKPNEDCFKQPIDLQYTCLTQSGNQTLLDDGHAQSMVASLANGSSADFINSASYTQLAGAGMYSAYVGTVVDLVRLMSGLHTAHYQYIPAIAFPTGESLNLRLNTPPSFTNPKSVIVIGLPAIKAATPPPLRESDPNHVNCLLKPAVVLPIEGAPLVYSTSFAHDLVLHINGPGAGTDIQVTPNAYQGGLVLAPVPLRRVLPLPSNTNDSGSSAATLSMAQPALKPHSDTNIITGTIKGYWGFDKFTGPTLQLQDVPGKGWKLASGDILIAGRENHLTLTSTGTACINSIALDTAAGKSIETHWKQSTKPASVDLTISLKSVDPGAMHLAIHQYGELNPTLVAAETFSEPAQLNKLVLHAGDTSATLTGASLNQVKQLAFGGLVFTPDPSSSDDEASTSVTSKQDTLRLSLPPDSPTPKFNEGEKITARFALNDGRTLTLPVTVEAPRPSVVLLNKRIADSNNNPIQLADQNDLPLRQQLTFSLRSSEPFSRQSKIEIANADGTLQTMLSLQAGTLVLQNPHTLLATLDPLHTFGTSAFGPLRLRPIAPDGTTGDWIPLVTLVRLPDLRDVQCTAEASAPCTLEGENLYLVDAVATDASFTSPTTVPEGFVGTTLELPKPSKSGFYLRLRDDPAAANIVKLPVIVPRPVRVIDRAAQTAKKPEAAAPAQASETPSTQSAQTSSTKAPQTSSDKTAHLSAVGSPEAKTSAAAPSPAHAASSR